MKPVRTREQILKDMSTSRDFIDETEKRFNRGEAIDFMTANMLKNHITVYVPEYLAELEALDAEGKLEGEIF
ncbi:MAG: hypothetical protein FWC70_09920 [Defluviitaleaceae bacterium]|nr:hypothetical protein [Defluviitaleaceae bacterium]